MKKIALSLLALIVIMSSCKKDKNTDDNNNNTPPAPRLVFKYKFDSTQVRLDGFGQPATVPNGHGAQSPVFYKMSSHYMELAPTATTLLGQGSVLYHNPEVTGPAIDFSQAIIKGNNEEFFSKPLSQITPGTYNYLRVSLAYQNYDVKFYYNSMQFTGRLASFIGYNTYITNYKIKDSTVVVNANKLQGYWAFETIYNVVSGQAPPGATTVPNPIWSTSPVPQGSCVVTGQFANPLTITGNETSDIVIIVSLSTNKSFEWTDAANNNMYEPLNGDTVIDMGIRGMIPIVQ